MLGPARLAICAASLLFIVVVEMGCEKSKGGQPNMPVVNHWQTTEQSNDQENRQSPKQALPGTPTVVDSKFLDTVPNQATIAISNNGISINGETVIPLKNRELDDSELQRGGLYDVILRLTKYVETTDLSSEKREAGNQTFSSPSSRSINIFAEPDTPYLLLFQVVASLRSKYDNFSLIVASPNKALGSFPVSLPLYNNKAAI